MGRGDPLPVAVPVRDFGNEGRSGLPIRASWRWDNKCDKAGHRRNCSQVECEVFHKGSSIPICLRKLKSASLKKDCAADRTRGISWGVLGYGFDACRTGRVTAFASDLHLTRSGIAARFTTVFLATFHYTGAGNVGTSILLSCCHKFLLHSRELKNARHYSAPER